MADKKQFIDPNEFWKQLNKSRYDFFTYPDGRCGYSLGTISDVLWRTKSVDAVEVVHGEWIMCLDVDDVEYIECSNCGGEFYDGDNDTFDKPYNYCPNCGANMYGGK